MKQQAFERLEVWQQAIRLIKGVYAVARELPASETYGLGDQFRRSAVSVALNIAEGRAAASDAEFRRFLGIALRSLVEVQACARVAVALEMLEPAPADKLCEESDHLEARLRLFRKKLTPASRVAPGLARKLDGTRKSPGVERRA